MDFRILGPLEVVVDAPVKLGGAQQRALLALLLIHAGETLTTDRLVDELWGERPPPTAVKTVQVYISQLRKLLGAGRVERGGGGYRLVATADEVDARRFEAKVSAGRGALEAGRLADAVATLTEADQLWRGPALAGLDLRWALSAAARLEDLRVAAQEDRIEAELELGRHAALTSELEALCHAHPLRERLVAQRMLALYRSGRQADALEAYRDARERLVGELGLEPGLELRQLERRMLVQDPQLAAPARVLTPTQRRRRGALIGVLVVVVAATAIVALPRDRAVLPAPGPNTAVAVDPASLEVVHRARVGDVPSAVVVAAGGAWVVNGNDETVSFVESDHGQVVRTVATRATPLDVARSASSVWVLNRPLTLVRIDPQAARVVERIALQTPSRLITETSAQSASVAAVDDEVWVSDGSWLWRVRPGTRRPVVRRAAPLPGPLAVATSAWVGAVSEVDRDTLRLRRRVRLAGRAEDIAVGAGAVWIADGLLRRVQRVDPHSGRVTHSTDVGGLPTGVAVGEGAVWVSLRAGELVRLDRRSGAVSGRVTVGGSPRAVAAGEGLVWVAAS